MITAVVWSLIVLDKTIFTGHRVKRISSTNPANTPFQNGVDTPGNSAWTRIAPAVIPFGGNNYNFAFWSLSGTEFSSTQQFASVSSDPAANVSLSGSANWTLVARAWYVWDFGTGPGDNAIAIDAFDIDANDFMAQDFVNVNPDDPQRTLTKAANDGYLDSDTQIEAGVEETIHARNLNSFKFANWQAVNSITFGNPSINGQDLVVHHHDRIVAIAFYHKIPPFHPPPPPPHLVFPGAVRLSAPTVILQLGGDTGVVPAPLGTPPVGPPGSPELVGASKLLEVANNITGPTRIEVLNAAERLALAAAKQIRKDARKAK